VVNDARFTPRACPACASTAGIPLLELRAQDFCAPNFTYRSDYPAILGVSPESRYPIGRCGACGFVYAAFLPDAAFLALLYEKVIRHEDNVAHNEAHASYARRMSYVAALLALAPSGRRLRALDFGCGIGTTLRLLRAADVQGVGYDFSAVRSKHVASADLYVVADEAALARAGPFDLLVCDNVIEHLGNPLETLRMLASLATHGALLYVSVPNSDAAYISTQVRCLREGTPVDMSFNPWEHLNYFDTDHLDQLLGRAGFVPIPSTDPGQSVDIGLRAEQNRIARIKNAAASGFRLIGYALNGKALSNPNHRFYRLSDRASQ